MQGELSSNRGRVAAALALALLAPPCPAQISFVPRRIEPKAVEIPAAPAGDLPLPEGALARLGPGRFRGPSSILEVALSPSGRTVALADGQRDTLSLWDAASGRERHSIGRYSVGSMRWSPDREHLIVVTDDYQDPSVVILSLRTLQPRHILRGHAKRIHALSLTPDGARLATLDAEGELRTWDLRAGALLAAARIGEGVHRGDVALSPDGEEVAVVRGDETLLLLDAESGRTRERWDVGSWAQGVAYTPSGDALLVARGGFGGRLALRRREDGGALWERELRPAPGEVVRFSPDGRRIALGRDRTSAAQGHAWHLDAATGEVLQEAAWPWRVADVAYVDGAPRFLLEHGAAWEVRALPDTPAPAPPAHAPAHHRGVIHGIAFTEDGERMVSLDSSGQLNLWRTRDWSLRRTHRTGELDRVLALAPRGDRVATAAYRKLRVFSLDAFEIAFSLELDATIDGLWFSSDGRFLLVGLDDGRLEQIDLGGEMPRGTYVRVPASVEALASTPDGAHLLVGWSGAKGGIRVLDARTREVVRQVDRHDLVVSWIEVAPDGETVFSVGRWKGQRWELDTGRLLAENGIGTTGTLVGRAAWEHGRFALASGPHVRAYALETGQPLADWAHGESSVTAMALAPDGRTLLTGGRDSRIYLWDVLGEDRRVTVAPLPEDPAPPAPRPLPPELRPASDPAEAEPVPTPPGTLRSFDL